MYCPICLMQIVLLIESIFIHYFVYLSLGYFGILESTGVVDKVEVEVEMEYKYEELAKALENFGNGYYIFLLFLFVCLIL